MIKSLYAICLLVENLEKSLSFYTNVLELKVNSKDDGYIDFKLGDTLLAIFQKEKATAMFAARHMNRGGSAVLAFQVENVDEMCQMLHKKGVEIFEGPKTMPWGQVVAYFKDPDSNIWEITSYG
jgi:catechol 2,3-dioxygenase-like lactoylglutathione lyase family enzyme